ncbi:MAG TPA: ABC transporter substrate-binding protein, partial [Xanthobacteraceae bacterium]|nr:ABC transporter substrate-binding protein [Xanthobacteraceae bacterium]
MQAQTSLKFAAATALATILGLGAAQAQDLKFGAVGPKTGPLASGAAVTHFPNFQLWVKQVNDRGGLKLKSGQRKIVLIENDDRSQPPEAIKIVERLASVDKVDFILPAYSTGINLATAPIYAKYNYPQIAQAMVTDQGAELVKRYPNLFVFQAPTSAFAQGAVDVLKKMKDAGQIGDKVAMVNIADAFGIELANAGRDRLAKAGFKVVYDRSYPLGT